jgi:hypothetical protein
MGPIARVYLDTVLETEVANSLSSIRNGGEGWGEEELSDQS